MEIEEMRKLADTFFEWLTEDRTQVTLTSALLFAQHVLRMTQPAPIPAGWQPIETAPDGLHLRAAWVYNVPNNDWIIEVHSGYVDDDGMFVNQYGDTYGIAPNGYFGWQPLPPAPGASDD